VSRSVKIRSCHGQKRRAAAGEHRRRARRPGSFIATRPDGRSLHQATIDGVKVEVIKNGPTVEAGYATGSVGFQSAQKFLTGSN